MELNNKKIRVLRGLLLTEKAELNDLIEASNDEEKRELSNELEIVNELLQKIEMN